MPATLAAHRLFSSAAPRQDGSATENALPAVNSLDLLRGQKTIEIMHNGAVYRLQATKLGKLILTK
jgi:hemin uptake protein HemP